MYPTIFQCYGPIAIQSYGAMILIALLVFSTLFLLDPRRAKLISTAAYGDLLIVAIFTAIIGGRLLSVITQFPDLPSLAEIIAPWYGGFSVLGSILALLLVVPWHLRRKGIAPLPVLDLMAIYAPLLQAIARLGCFLAGCCYGIENQGWLRGWFPEHPTQLYSAGLLGIIFLVMYLWVRPWVKIPGVALFLYLMLVSVERVVVDFWRADREFFAGMEWFSSAQIIALLLFSISGMMLIGFRRRKVNAPPTRSS